MKPIHTIACALTAAIGLAGVVVSGQQPAAPVEIGWIGLYSDRLMMWMENENRLRELCAMSPQSPEWQRCRREMLEPMRLSVTLRSGPSETTASPGSLMIVGAPGQLLRAFFAPANGGPPIEFQPDQYDSDWGYGPSFHETFVERRGAWFRLPAVPFPKGTWLDATQLSERPDVLLLTDEAIVTSPFGDLFVLGIETGVLRVRPEQPADMWCDGDDPPPIKPFRERRIPVRDLYTATGHLKLHIKYTRGC